MSELPQTPRALEALLEGIFPGFIATLEHDRFEWEAGERNLHSVMIDFARCFAGVAKAASRDQLERFGAFLLDVRATEGNLENAVDTCFLEHARQLGVEKRLRPWLRRPAR